MSRLDPGVRTLLLPLLGLVAGFGAIALAWVGASRQLLLPATLPWLVSGGFAGLALIGGGSAMAAVVWRRRAVAREVVLLDTALALVHELRRPG